MKFRYTPEGAEPKEWPFNPNKLLNVEAEEIERHTGLTYGEFAEAIDRHSMQAFHALLYVFLKRETPTLRYNQVQFTNDEIDLELELEDKIRARDQFQEALDSGDVSRENEDAVRESIAALDKQITDEQQPPKPETDEAPKEPTHEPSSLSTGGLHSLPSSTSAPESSTG